MYFYLVRPGITPRLNLALFVGFGALFIIAWRHVINKWLGSAWQLRTVMIGSSPDATELAKYMREHPQLGYTLIAHFTIDEEDAEKIKHETRVLPIPSLTIEQAIKMIENERINIVAPAAERGLPALLIQRLYQKDRERVQIISLPELFETTIGKVPVQSIDPSWFLKYAGQLEKPMYEIAKRIIDVLLSCGAFIAALMIAPFIYAAIKLDSPGSGFFVQHRVGRRGKIFLAVKFRTMYWDTAAKGPRWVVPQDPRVTRVGKWLRRTRLDELPQLINVFKGDMSFIGPRPEQPGLVADLSIVIPFYQERHMVKPGLTGWDQISGTYHSASVADTLEKLQYDLYYIKNRTVGLDMVILMRTIKTVLSAAGR